MTCIGTQSQGKQYRLVFYTAPVLQRAQNTFKKPYFISPTTTFPRYVFFFNQLLIPEIYSDSGLFTLWNRKQNKGNLKIDIVHFSKGK